MSSIPHIPALRRGKACKSLDKTEVKDFRTGEVKATGPIPTMKISWDQPHEGNMFEFLWQRRAFEKVA